MKLNQSIYIAMLVLGGTFIAGCQKDFLQRDPQTNVTAASFFKTPADLQTYTNGLYGQLQFGYDDLNSDNISNYNASGEVDNLVRGTISQNNYGGWDKSDWSNLRSINYMLDHVGTVTGNQTEINHYIGIARFFRGWFYFAKVKKYSNVPWYGSVLSSEDEALYKGQDPRADVVNHILEDLQFAADNIQATGGNTRITKWAALTLLARFALHEGTFRKYHDELGLGNDYNRFLKIAADATSKIMTEGGFSIYNTGKGGEDYRNLFSSNTLATNKEIILWADFDQKIGRGNNSHTVFDYTYALSKSLADSYLKTDGTPVAANNTMLFTQMFANRDPRMMETIGYPGFVQTGTTVPYKIKATLGGLNQIKFYPRSTELMQGWQLNFTDLPIFRLAEVLLINAEAKAELGELTQGDLDKTVNLLRKRVNMPNLAMGVAEDPALVAMYPNATATNKAVLLEIRRERRVELACEGLRYDDLMRWKSGMLLQNSQVGIYVPALGAMDVTGDGVEDIAILASPSDESPIANLPASVKAGLGKYYLKDASGNNTNFYLTNGTSGFIAFTRDRDQPRIFIEPKYYYRPIPVGQISLNPKLKQVFGWDQ
ncbi:RagB/SusD family nutrient uptake outer membrane protein [Pedobacter sp. KR3-3]|uniref:RagB/SusD family nutrient uptake outer membrane protein n=1 Tax=Pedobacter albus TaxID=3113905 RepID=A0ABU7I7F9_9SPHI|nr:RagB/SusD family nutrient uptake outer membrane protein [Pedobacter sp. KR3-3]MEE1945395.1 RagB/SusD family nutrient uptake outer membrane protein [Pedobacter sp. KR3-3]